MSNLLDGLVNKFYNSDVGRVLLDDNGSYASTPYNSDFIPEYVTTTGMKRFSTAAAIPNLPKPSTLFFVHFSLNPQAQVIINKRKTLIQYLVNDTATDTKQSSSAFGNLVDNIKGSLNSMRESFNRTLSSSLASLGDMFGFKAPEIKSTGTIPTTSNSRTYGDYIPDGYLLNQLSFELSKFVKNISKPSISFTVNQYNEYNRRRLVYDKMDFGDLKITLWDVKDNPASQFFFAYLKLISNDFLSKSFMDFRKQIVTNEFDTDITDWGFHLDSNFRLIEKISLCEYYMDKVMVYTYENPVITNIDFGQNKMGSWDPSEVSLTFKFEGITNDLLDITPYNTEWIDDKSYLKSMINSDIRAEMANFMNVRYKSGLSMGVDTALSFLKGILDAPKEERWKVLKEQSLDTLRKLGFADEVNMFNSLKDDYDNFKSSKDKGKYLLKMTDDPSSFLGELLNDGASSAASGLLGLFF